MQKRVVIVGGGFAGVKAALELCKDPQFAVTLISNRNHFEYHAALYRSVTGRSVLEVVLPLATIFQGKSVEIVEDTVKEIKHSKRLVVGQDNAHYLYDTLILALGNITAYYGIKGLEEYSYGVKSATEALRLKRHLHEQLNNRQKIDEHYVVVGAGPTGIELAAELQLYLVDLYRKHRVTHKKFTVNVVEAADNVLPSVPTISARVVSRLQSLGIHLDLGTAVKGETADMLKLPHGDIKTHTVIWTAGVTGHPLFASCPDLFKPGKGGRVVVDKHLKAADDIYILGDAAQTQFSGMAQTALYDAKFVTRVLRGEKPTYRPKQPIAAIPVGHKWCAVAIGRFTVYGKLGWLVRRWLDLKLYLNLLSPMAALRTWLYGSQVAESCPVCSKK